MKYLNYFIILTTSLVLIACSPDNSPKPKLFEEQRNALDQAKGIDAKVQQQADETNKSMEKQSQ